MAKSYEYNSYLYQKIRNFLLTHPSLNEADSIKALEENSDLKKWLLEEFDESKQDKTISIDMIYDYINLNKKEIAIFENNSKESIIFDAMAKIVTKDNLYPAYDDIKTRVHKYNQNILSNQPARSSTSTYEQIDTASQKKRLQNEIIQHIQTSSKITALQPTDKTENKVVNVQSYAHESGIIKKEKLTNGHFNFAIEGDFTGIITVKRVNSNNKILHDEIDILEVKNGKVTAMLLANKGICRINNIESLKQQSQIVVPEQIITTQNASIQTEKQTATPVRTQASSQTQSAEITTQSVSTQSEYKAPSPPETRATSTSTTDTQTSTATMVDSSTQHSGKISSTSNTQTEIKDTQDSSSQHEAAPSHAVGSQTETKTTAESGIQSDSPSTSQIETQTEIRDTQDSSSQHEAAPSHAVGSQTEMKNFKDSATQSDISTSTATSQTDAQVVDEEIHKLLQSEFEKLKAKSNMDKMHAELIATFKSREKIRKLKQEDSAKISALEQKLETQQFENKTEATKISAQLISAQDRAISANKDLQIAKKQLEELNENNTNLQKTQELIMEKTKTSENKIKRLNEQKLQQQRIINKSKTEKNQALMDLGSVRTDNKTLIDTIAQNSKEYLALSDKLQKKTSELEASIEHLESYKEKAEKALQALESERDSTLTTLKENKDELEKSSSKLKEASSKIDQNQLEIKYLNHKTELDQMVSEHYQAGQAALENAFIEQRNLLATHIGNLNSKISAGELALAEQKKQLESQKSQGQNIDALQEEFDKQRKQLEEQIATLEKQNEQTQFILDSNMEEHNIQLEQQQENFDKQMNVYQSRISKIDQELVLTRDLLEKQEEMREIQTKTDQLPPDHDLHEKLKKMQQIIQKQEEDIVQYKNAMEEQAKLDNELQEKSESLNKSLKDQKYLQEKIKSLELQQSTEYESHATEYESHDKELVSHNQIKQKELSNYQEQLDSLLKENTQLHDHIYEQQLQLHHLQTSANQANGANQKLAAKYETQCDKAEKEMLSLKKLLHTFIFDKPLTPEQHNEFSNALSSLKKSLIQTKKEPYTQSEILPQRNNAYNRKK